MSSVNSVGPSPASSSFEKAEQDLAARRKMVASTSLNVIQQDGGWHLTFVGTNEFDEEIKRREFDLSDSEWRELQAVAAM